MENEILSLVTIANLYKYVHVLQVFSLIDKYIARDHQPNFGFQTMFHMNTYKISSSI